jgi:hypothetical protein
LTGLKHDDEGGVDGWTLSRLREQTVDRLSAGCLITFFLAKIFTAKKQAYLLLGCVSVKIGPGGEKNTEKSPKSADKAGIAVWLPWANGGNITIYWSWSRWTMEGNRLNRVAEESLITLFPSGKPARVFSNSGRCLLNCRILWGSRGSRRGLWPMGLWPRAKRGSIQCVRINAAKTAAPRPPPRVFGNPISLH